MKGLIKFLQQYVRLQIIHYSHDMIGGKKITITVSLHFKDVMISSTQTVIHI